MGKCCLVMNMAPHYVAESYVLMDRSFDMKWCFGENHTDIREMDHSQLNDVSVFPVRRVRRFYWLGGAGRIARNHSVSTYIILGELHFLTAWILPRMIRLFNPSARVYFWAHGWYGTESRFLAWLKKRLFAPADAIILYGNYARNLMIQNGFQASRLYVIHNALAHSEQLDIRRRLQPSPVYHTHFGNDYPTLVVIGRLTERKRIGLLFQAVDMLRHNGLDLNVVVIGDGNARADLVNQSVSLHIEDRIWFFGPCYDEGTNAEMIYNADICVVSGDVGLTAIHVMTYGTPCITHDDFKHQGPEFESVIPGVTGSFFRAGDVNSLAEAISCWLADHPDREAVRVDCYSEIDRNWTPEFELSVLKELVV